MASRLQRIVRAHLCALLAAILLTSGCAWRSCEVVHCLTPRPGHHGGCYRGCDKPPLNPWKHASCKSLWADYCSEAARRRHDQCSSCESESDRHGAFQGIDYHYTPVYDVSSESPQLAPPRMLEGPPQESPLPIVPAPTVPPAVTPAPISPAPAPSNTLPPVAPPAPINPPAAAAIPSSSDPPPAPPAASSAETSDAKPQVAGSDDPGLPAIEVPPITQNAEQSPIIIPAPAQVEPPAAAPGEGTIEPPAPEPPQNDIPPRPELPRNELPEAKPEAKGAKKAAEAPIREVRQSSRRRQRY
jgi:hypothetical protein